MEVTIGGTVLLGVVDTGTNLMGANRLVVVAKTVIMRKASRAVEST